MAEEIERNGARFYRKAAEKAANAEIKQMFLDMAITEDGHLETFEEMRLGISEAEKAEMTFDPENLAARYLQTMADAHGIEGKKSPTEQLTGTESISEILGIAVNAEKESIVFYSGLKNFVSAKAGKDKVDAIIIEEVGHVATLNQRQLLKTCRTTGSVRNAEPAKTSLSHLKNNSTQN